jgi:hypothetical protein
MNVNMLTVVRSCISNISTGELAGCSFAVAYVWLLATLLRRRWRREYVSEELKARRAELQEQPRLNATPMEPGVSESCTLLPTRIEELDKSRFDFEHAHLLAGWVSPKGHYYKVASSCGHARLAERITGREFGSRALEHENWVHLTLQGVPGMFGPSKKFTREQIETLTDIAMVSPDTFFGKAIMSALAAASD